MGASKKKSPLFIVISENIYYLYAKQKHVRTKLLDLTVYIKGTPLPVINSEMDVYVDWDLQINKNPDSASLLYSFTGIDGRFNVHESKELYQKTSEYKFRADETWKYAHVPYCADSISPTSAIINFDDKTVKIKF
jgi:hypothetical protein